MADEKKVNGAEEKSADKKVEKKPKSNKPPFATRVKNFVVISFARVPHWFVGSGVGVGVAVGVLDLGLSELIKLLGNIN